ncbi:MAG: adenylate/guanylate cyclase domain-containing protein [Candidatus Hydrogenedentota bacterium]
MVRAFWKSFDLTKALPVDIPELQRLLKSCAPSDQAVFLRECAECTSWRQLPALKGAVRAIWARPTKPTAALEAFRSVHLAHLFYYWAEFDRALAELDAAFASKHLTRRDEGLARWVEGKIHLSMVSASSEVSQVGGTFSGKARRRTAGRRMGAAYAALRKALQLLTDRYPADRGRACATYGLFYRRIGESEKARFWLEKALSYFKGNAELHGKAMVYGNLGHLYRETGRYAEALYCFDQDRKIGVKVGDVFGHIINDIRIGDIYRVLGKNEKARENYEIAIRLGEKHPEQSAPVMAMLGMARIEASRKRPAEARRWVTRALPIIRSQPHLRYRQMLKVTEARIARHSGNLGQARRHLSAAIKLAVRGQDVFPVVRTQYEAARVHILSNRKSSGRKHLLQALRISEHASHHELMLWCEQLLAVHFPYDLAAARLGRYLGHHKAERILLPGSIRRIGGRRVLRTILAGDLRGFTSLSERIPPDRVTDILNRYFDAATSMVEKYGGNIDKFMGDGFLAVFPGNRAGVHGACRSALALLQEAEDLTTILARQLNSARLEIGMGIDTGHVVEGEVGSVRRFDFTVIGDVVNTASRLQAVANGGEIYLTPAVMPFLKGGAAREFPTRFVGKIPLKGKVKPVPTHCLDSAED